MTNDASVQALDVEDRDRFTMVYDDVWHVLKGKSALSVYMALKRRTNSGRKEWFGTHKGLAEEAGVSEKTFRRGIEVLESLGLVVTVRRFAPKGWDRKDESKIVYGEKTDKSQEEIGKLYRIRFHLPVGNSDQTGGGKNDQTPPGNSDQTGGGKNDHQTDIPLDLDTNEVDTRSAPAGAPSSQKYSKEFEEFWKLYPRKADKEKGQEKFKEQLLVTDLETLMTAVKNYRAEVDAAGTAKIYLPMCKTWLGQERWRDYLTASKINGGQSEPSVDEIMSWEINWDEEDSRAAGF